MWEKKAVDLLSLSFSIDEHYEGVVDQTRTITTHAHARTMSAHFAAASRCNAALARDDAFDAARAFAHRVQLPAGAALSVNGVDAEPAPHPPLAPPPTANSAEGAHAEPGEGAGSARFAAAMARLDAHRASLSASQQRGPHVVKARSTAHEVNAYDVRWGRALGRGPCAVACGPAAPPRRAHRIDALHSAALASVLQRHSQAWAADGAGQ